MATGRPRAQLRAQLRYWVDLPGSSGLYKNHIHSSYAQQPDGTDAKILQAGSLMVTPRNTVHSGIIMGFFVQLVQDFAVPQYAPTDVEIPYMHHGFWGVFNMGMGMRLASSDATYQMTQCHGATGSVLP